MGAENATLTAGPDQPAAASGRPRIGDVIAEKFRIERLIGQGGMGFVMAARHVELNELFAIKFIENRAESDVIASGRFHREARATLRLKNEHVVRVFDASAGQGDSMPYIIMEYLEGSDLAGLLQRSGPLPVTLAIDYVLQACEAIAEAHALGIVHRDIKPSNLMLTSGAGGAPVIKVLDFGISTGPSDTASADFTLTATGAVFGSPVYMSPEQLRSTKHVDHRADVWSLGVVLYELVCGKAPFDAASSVELSIAIVMDNPAPMRQLRPDTPPDLERTVRACLQKSREARVQSVGELAALLRPLASPLGVASCDTIARIASAGAPLSMPVSGTPSARPSTPVSFGKTEPELAPLTVARSSRRGTSALLGAFVAVAALCVFLATQLAARRGASPATEVPAAAAPAPSPTATEAPPPASPAQSLPLAIAPNPTSATTAASPSPAPTAPPSAALAGRGRPPSFSTRALGKEPAAKPNAAGSSAPSTPAVGVAVPPKATNASDPDLPSRF